MRTGVFLLRSQLLPYRARKVANAVFSCNSMPDSCNSFPQTVSLGETAMRGFAELALFSPEGRRKYLCASELTRFLKAAESQDKPTRLFCYVLVLTGARISEALSIAPCHLDIDGQRILLKTLKRRRVAFRLVPLPPALVRSLAGLASGKMPEKPLWDWTRQTAWRRVKRVMGSANIEGPQATARGLRHSFGMATAEDNLPMPLVQRLMGHARLETTSIYQQAVGNEERAFLRRLWRRLPIEC